MTTREASGPPGPEALVWVARALLAALVVVVVVWVERRTTWYLAIDQFGYLTFAEDLAQGRIAHPWPLLSVLRVFLPAGFKADVLAQTYVYDHGTLYCRYAPGFPLLLAGVRAVFGSHAVHYVNPVAAGLLLLVLFFLANRALGSEWLALVVALLVTLLPTYVLLWSISPLRDVPAHTTGLLALAALMPRSGTHRGAIRWAMVGLLLGLTITTRIDGVLYAMPAALLATWWRPWRMRDVTIAAVALLIGLLPLLTYDWIATGNPLVPTQAMELNQMLSRGPSTSTSGGLDMLAQTLSPAAAQAAEGGARRAGRARRLLQGGGLRLAHLRRTLPLNIEIYEDVFGRLGLALAALGAAASLARRPLFALTVPYVLVSTLFFSLWTRPDPRYLAGSILLIAILVVHGGAFAASLPRRLRLGGWGRAPTFGLLLAAALAIGWWVGAPDFAESSARPWAILALEGGLALAWGIGLLNPGRSSRVAFGVGTAIALSLIVVWRTSTSLAVRGSFQRPQVELARRTIEGAVGERAVILTTSDIGRPAENINYYTRANAVYLREVARWGLTPGYLLGQVTKAGFEAYLLLPPAVARSWMESEFVYPWFRPEMIARIPATQARRWFVASPAHNGVPLWLVRMHRRPEPLVTEDRSGS